MSQYGEGIAVNRGVEVSPHFDVWMMGAKHGVVQTIKDGIARVKMDHPGLPKHRRFLNARVEDLKLN